MTDDKLKWHRAKRCAEQYCVEVADLGHGEFAMRRSDDPFTTLLFNQKEIEAFILGAKDGDFDHLIHS